MSTPAKKQKTSHGNEKGEKAGEGEVAIHPLRSSRYFEQADDLNRLRHNSRCKQMGYDRADFKGKPFIAIMNTWSDLLPCHSHFKQRVEDVKRGVWQAGGFPVELPSMALSETFMKPTPMLYRNLLAMQIEEQIRSQPVDGVVLMGGCDKTTPGLVMGALSAGLPFIYVPCGPMLTAKVKGKPIGSGTDMWKVIAEYRAGTVGEEQVLDVEDALNRSPGHCMTMGTASTMTAMAETLGLTIPGASSIPAVDSMHCRMASRSGRRVVEMVAEQLTPDKILSRRSFENAIAATMALGGSTNAIIHLIAMAGRAGVKLPLQAFDDISKRVPLLANVKPSGKFLMEDFYFAGGLRALLAQLTDVLHTDCIVAGDVGAGTVTTLAKVLEGAEVHDPEVIVPRSTPLKPDGGTQVLFGNLCPDGAVIKGAAAEPTNLVHTGPALVFSSYDDLSARIDDPDLVVDKDTVLVLQSAGPTGGPGMPEWGQLPIPKKLLKQGVRDMVRISDARMSGTSYGTCVLHVSPESHVGGPLALVRDGDRIELDVPARRLQLHVADAELATRKEAWAEEKKGQKEHYPRGFGAMYAKHVTQAHLGCDFDFLHRIEGKDGETPEPSIHH